MHPRGKGGTLCSVQSSSSPPARILGRYALYEEIASGGMATVHFGRLLGVVGFAKTVAIKRLHPQLARDPEFVSMFLDEARLAARVRHPNVVSTLDVVALERELFLVMEYVQGDSLRHLVRNATAQGGLVPPPIVATIMVGVLHGLHAAHEAGNERGEPLGIVHRDVSPQNILVGIDGVPRVFDFGVAKAAGRAQTTREGQLKGKLPYMSPEQLMGRGVTRATDVFAASAVLWEALVGKRLFKGDSEGEIVRKVLDAEVVRPSELVPGLPPQLDALVLRGLARDPDERFATAREMARALEKCLPMAPASDVGEFVEKTAAATLAIRAERMAKIESASHGGHELMTGTPATPPPVTAPLVASDVTPSSSSASLLQPQSRSTPSGAPTQTDVANAAVRVAIDPRLQRGGDSAALALRGERRPLLRRLVLGAVAIACALLLVALGTVLRTPHEDRAAAAVTVAPPAAPPATAPTDVPVPSVTAASLPAPAPTEAQPVAAASAAPLETAPTHVKFTAPKPTAVRHAAVGCDPPFTVDGDGFRHYKRECMK